MACVDWEYARYRRYIDLSPNNEVFSTDRFWRLKNLLWRPAPRALHDGTGTGKSRGTAIMDTAECCSG